MVRVRAGGDRGGRRAVAVAVAGPAVLLVALLGGCGSSSDGRAAEDRDPDSSTGAESSTTAVDGAVEPSVTATTAPPTTAPPVDLRSADLAGRRYRALCPGGEVEVDAASGPASGGGIALSGFAPQFYDLTGDGRPEAVVPVTCAAGGDWTTAVASVIVIAAGPIGPAQMGGPIEGRNPVVVGRSIGVGRSSLQPGDPPCCPRSTRYEAVAFVDGSWGPAAGGAPLTEADPAVPEGLGAVTIGAPFGDIAIATGQTVEVSDPLATGGACVEVTFPEGPSGLRGLGGEGALRSIDVRTPGIRTVEGLGVGSTEADVLASHPGEITVLPPGVFGGRDLVRTPVDFPDLITVFHSDGTTVTGYSIGEPTWADAPNGCA